METEETVKETVKPAPVLTAAQQKKAIAGSKQQKRKVVINTLDSPLDLDWPRLGAENEEKINALLNEYLGPVRVDSVSIPRKLAEGVPRKERAGWRKAERAKAQEASSSSLDKTKMSDCIVGFRDVVKAIGKREACLVLCDRNPNPPTLTKLLVPLCHTKGIPLLALKNFTANVKKLLRLPRCLTLALSVGAKEGASPLHQLYTKAVEICGGLGPSPAGDPPRPPPSSAVSVEAPSSAGSREEDEDDGRATTTTKAITGPIERYHLKRDGSGRFQKRAFIPGITPNPLAEGGPRPASSTADFIALPSGPPSSGARQSGVSLRYPRIKQIRPNDNKKKAGGN